MRRVAFFIINVFLFLFSCQPKAKEKIENTITDNIEKKPLSKPPSLYQDTLQVAVPTAVFYYPDSIQLATIKEKMEQGNYEATIHEFYYQMRNARLVLTKNWPRLKIAEAKNARYIKFIGMGMVTVIDLNLKNDLYGIILFQPGSSPHITDMMNIDTELGSYFKK